MEQSSYMDVFIEEARENLEQTNASLLRLEEKGTDEEATNAAFRALHTIKGTAAVLGIEPVSELTHAMEDIFDLVRKGTIQAGPQLMELMLKGADRIGAMLDELEKQGSTHLSFEDLTKQMAAFRVDSQRPSTAVRDEEFRLTPAIIAEARKEIEDGKRVFIVRATFEQNCALREGRAFQMHRVLSLSGNVIAAQPSLSQVGDATSMIHFVAASTGDEDSLGNALLDVTGIDELRVEEARLPAQEEGKQECAEKAEDKSSPSAGSATIRVKSKLLDQLLDLVGEIMINNIRIIQIADDLKNRELKQTLQNNTRLMTQLQSTVLRTRMVPVEFIFKRFPRMVRDMAKANGKEVEFTMRGNDIEIDRGLLDEIGDALVHLLRNAVDHGLEPSQERIASGKPAEGKVVLSAFQEQSNIVITVEDDGRGIDPGKVKAKALSKGVITEEDAAKMDERAIINLVFLPGFSTAEKVTDISGRGVGMDVVKTKIEGMGGFVRLDSVLGKGCKITLKLPPSLSIIRAMLVEVNNEKYAIPLENVRETVKVPLANIHEVADKGVLRLREKILPVLNIHADFGGSMAAYDREMPAIIVEKNESSACLLVSRLIGQQEIVVKSVGRDLREPGFFSGATILGDGKVAMILDVGAFV